jgi:hypothetical protein
MPAQKVSESPEKRKRADSEQGRINLESAWRAHAAQESWAAKVDTKASIFLAVDGVVLSAILTARSQSGNVFATLDGWRGAILTAALVLCGVAGVLATVVVFPILGGRRSSNAGRDRGMIYFGDLRRRQAGELAHQLAGLTFEDQFGQVSRQLVAMARTTWIKHRLLQVALASALAGFVAIMSALMLR